tara:strand:- start:888 stop:1058 length:171 start_codon:yes stop_codon:yes gene_type:complete
MNKNKCNHKWEIEVWQEWDNEPSGFETEFEIGVYVCKYCDATKDIEGAEWTPVIRG